MIFIDHRMFVLFLIYSLDIGCHLTKRVDFQNDLCSGCQEQTDSLQEVQMYKTYKNLEIVYKMYIECTFYNSSCNKCSRLTRGKVYELGVPMYDDPIYDKRLDSDKGHSGYESKFKVIPIQSKTSNPRFGVRQFISRGLETEIINVVQLLRHRAQLFDFRVKLTRI